MSTFIHGGSALKLDVGAKAHAALEEGDVVGINPTTVGSDEGYSTIAVGDLNTAIQQVTMHGVVLGVPGKNSFATGEDVLIRIVGAVDVKATNGTAAGEVLRLTVNNKYLTDAAAGTAATAQYAAATRWFGVAHTANATGGVAIVRAYVNGFGFFG
jgi:hypothetical protein